MEHTAIFEEQVSLTPRDLRAEIKTIDSLLEEKCKKRLEGHCSRHGFVMSDSVKILSRSMGLVERGRFTGNIIFHVQAEGSVLNPPDGIIIEGTVIRKNKMGLYVNYKDAVRVIIPRDINIGNDEFEAVEVGETVKVEIKKSRFQINDEYILSVGLFHGTTKTPKSKRVSTVKEAEEEEEETPEEAKEEETPEEAKEEEAEDEEEETPGEEEAEPEKDTIEAV
jgi:DNA-directed RNA polymerase subunit E'/Rpb7